MDHLSPLAPPVTRAKRPYADLRPTQQWKRRRKAREAVTQVLDRIGVPLDVITPPSTPSPHDLLHLSTAERERFRTVRGIHLPCERTIIQCKKLLTATHATETGTFANGAYITDPVRFVSVLCAQSPFLAVGGDKGGDHTKLGITYGTEQTRKLPNGQVREKHSYLQHFAPLIVYAGSDHWEDMNELTTPSLSLHR